MRLRKCIVVPASRRPVGRRPAAARVLDILAAHLYIAPTQNRPTVRELFNLEAARCRCARCSSPRSFFSSSPFPPSRRWTKPPSRPSPSINPRRRCPASPSPAPGPRPASPPSGARTPPAPRASSPPLGAAAPSGTARFLSLAPGVYNVEFALEGFATVKETKRTLVLGENAKIPVTMQAKTSDVITVNAAAEVIDVHKTDTSTNILPEQIEQDIGRGVGLVDVDD